MSTAAAWLRKRERRAPSDPSCAPDIKSPPEGSWGEPSRRHEHKLSPAISAVALRLRDLADLAFDRIGDRRRDSACRNGGNDHRDEQQHADVLNYGLAAILWDPAVPHPVQTPDVALGPDSRHPAGGVHLNLRRTDRATRGTPYRCQPLDTCASYPQAPRNWSRTWVCVT